MKNLLMISLLACFFWSCRSKELSKPEALELIKRDKKYPHIIGYDIKINDAAVAKDMSNKGLQKAGFVVLPKTQPLKINIPVIIFAAKAKPYLLSAVPGTSIQKVRIATEQLKEIKEIIRDYLDKTVIVVYTTERIKKTPFNALLNNDSDTIKQHTAHYTRTETGWILTKGKN